MVETSLEEMGEKVRDMFSWEKIYENLPFIFALGIGLYALDKSIDISGKLKLITQGTKKLNRAELFESLDTIGDNIQLVDSVLRQFKIELGKADLKKIADFLQNLGTGGKYISEIIDIFKGKFSKNGIIVRQKGYSI